MAQGNASVEAAAAARKRTRSPAYPYVNLEDALERAKQFYGHEGRNAANISVVGKHWGYTEGSSSTAQTVAALISYGLMQDEGTGDKRAVRLTNSALRILLDTRPDSSERAELIKQAALSPKIHRQLWDKWESLPSDASLRHILLFDWETPFNENTVDYFIKEFRETIAFAKLSKADKAGGKEASEVESKKDESTSVKVGDYVQWVSQGSERFHELKRVVRLSDDGQFAFVEGEATGLPMWELEVGEAPAKPPLSSQLKFAPSQLQPPAPLGGVMRNEVFSLDGGGEVVITWPSPLPAAVVQDIKDWLKIVERKIARSVDKPEEAAQ